MRIEIHGHEIKVTAALRDYVESKFERLSRHFEQPFEVRTQLSLDKPDHRAEATVNLAGQILHADASALDMYAAIDLLADKLDRLLLKHKQKMVDNRRRGESIARSGEFG
jgi:ribosome hibernation promoting factor